MDFLTSPLWVQCLAEMVGTLLLVLLGNGVCFSINHRKMFANQPGKWIVISIGWAIAVFVGAFTSKAMGGPGQINPAVSVFSAFTNYETLAFIPMQFIGAILAQIILYIINWNFIKLEATSTDGDKAATRGSTCTNPAFDGKKGYLTNFLYELIATSILLLVIFLIGAKFSKPADGLTVVSIVTVTVLGLGMSLGSATGFAINPARDLGPRIIYQILLKTKTGKDLIDANWQYSWIPVVAPLLSGIIFGLASLI